MSIIKKIKQIWKQGYDNTGMTDEEFAILQHLDRSIDDTNDICPYCGEEILGGLSCREENGGFFSSTRYYSKYSCMECGTEWEVEE